VVVAAQWVSGVRTVPQVVGFSELQELPDAHAELHSAPDYPEVLWSNLLFSGLV